MQALRDAASTRSGVGGVNVSQGHSGLGSYPRWVGPDKSKDDNANYNEKYFSMEPTPVLTEELKRHLAETRAANDYRSQQVRRIMYSQYEGQTFSIYTSYFQVTSIFYIHYTRVFVRR